MYSKTLLVKYIDKGLKLKGMTRYQLSKALSISQSNLSRALESETHNLTINQLSTLTTLLELSPDDLYHILTGKKAKPSIFDNLESLKKVIRQEKIKSR